MGVANPKALATVYLSPTPEVQATPTPGAGLAAPHDGPPTPTPTAYVGVFLGEGSEIAVEGTYVSPPTLAAITEDNPPDAATADPEIGCAIPPASSFQSAWLRSAALKTALGCPVSEGFSLRIVYQPFEHGHMFYRDAGDIYALSEQSIRAGSPTDVYWHVIDTWQEGQPESDPSLSPPAGLQQPIRGFGNAWRNTPS
ncbi:MAG: hypothetical protein JXB47_17430, partial [Anaerolineae bacterium]|nr:hypothetical protein [Anaerolineae bacterium]